MIKVWGREGREGRDTNTGSVSTGRQGNTTSPGCAYKVSFICCLVRRAARRHGGQKVAYWHNALEHEAVCDAGVVGVGSSHGWKLQTRRQHPKKMKRVKDRGDTPRCVRPDAMGSIRGCANNRHCVVARTRRKGRTIKWGDAGLKRGLSGCRATATLEFCWGC